MAKFKEGERVRIKARQASEKEALEGRYAPYLANVTGTILRVYDAQQIAVNLDIDSLPEEVRQRHAEQQETMYQRWLDSLSEEARNRLTDEEKMFRLNYVVLVAESDLESPPPASSLRTREEPKGKEAGSLRQRGEPTPSKTVPPVAGGTSRRGSKSPKAQPTEGRATGKPRAERQDAKATKGRASQRAKSKPAAPRKSRKPSETARTSPPSARPTPEQLDLMEEAYLKARQRKAR
ncbi:MAG: hypothetical protein ABDI19_03985 [Armatimonadota bacterium]